MPHSFPTRRPSELRVQGDAPRIEGLQIIWKQDPKVPGRGHFSHRLAFSPDGQYLFVTSGERQTFDPAQDMAKNLGTVIRLNPDGRVPAENPFADNGGLPEQTWWLGQRHLPGIALAGPGKVWQQDAGPSG